MLLSTDVVVVVVVVVVYTQPIVLSFVVGVVDATAVSVAAVFGSIPICQDMITHAPLSCREESSPNYSCNTQMCERERHIRAHIYDEDE